MEKKNTEKSNDASCENCVYYDYNEEEDCFECTAQLDEDELVSLYNTKRCPLFRFYDEYKSVQKQN